MSTYRMRLTFFFTFFLLAFHAYAQENYGFFSGVVIDKGSNESLVGASVRVKDHNSLGAITDVNGAFSIKTPVGKYTFVVSYTGMKSDTFQVSILANKNIERTIKLVMYASELQGVVVRVGRFDQSLEDLTVSVEIMKPEFIENKAATSIVDVLDYVPGLNIIDGDPQIRGGSGFTFGVGSKVGVFIDGMPLLSADASTPMWDLIPLNNIQQVEIVKGASSVLSGSSSLSGAIYIKTADPPMDPVTNFSLTAGGYTTPKHSEMKWWDDFPYQGSMNFSHSRAYKNTDFAFGLNMNLDHGYEGAPKPGPLVVDTTTNFTDDQMSEKQYRFNFNLRHRNKKHKGLVYGINGNAMQHDTKLMLAWLDDSTGFYRAYPGGVLLQNKFIFYLDPYITYFMPSGTKHSLRTRYMFSNTDMSNGQNTQSSLVYADYNFRKDYSVLGGFKFIGGISTQYNSVLSDMYVGSGNNLNDLLNISGYAEVQDDFFNALNISVGVRLESYQLNGQLADIKPVFRAGATLKVLQETHIRGSWGQGYRYPTIAERFIRFSSGVIGVFDNPDLQPETSTNAEIGVKQGFKFLKYFGYLDISGFIQNYDNTIEYLFGFWDPTYSFAIGGFKFLNTGKSRIIGIDISLNGKASLSKKLKMTTMFGYTYIAPKSLEPDYVFTRDYSFGGGKDYSYNSTSVNPDNLILKYRFLHTVKGDIEFEYKNLAAGVSAKYYSPIVNLDKAIEDFEDATKLMGGTVQPVSYMNYFNNYNNGNLILDTRISYRIKKIHKLSFIVNNITNSWYSIRPLKAEAMRSILLQYSLKI